MTATITGPAGGTRHGLGTSQVARICRGQSWSHLGGAS